MKLLKNTEENSKFLYKHGFEFVATGGGISVLNNGTKTTVIAQDGTINVTDISVVDLTTTGDTILGDAAGDTTIINGDSTTLNTTLIVGVNDTGHDVQFFGATAGAHFLWDESADQLLLVGGATLDLSGKINLGLNGGADSASGLLMGVGTSANPATTSAAGNMFIECRTESTATSGDSRSLYLRHSLNGAGISGEAIRAFAKIEAAAATCRGAHISLDVASAGSCSGLGVGVDSQILVHNGALSGGTYAVANVEAYSAGSSTDISGVTEFSLARFSLGGDTTGAANVDDNAFFMTLTGGTIASGNIVETETDETKFSHKIRCKFNGTTLFLMATAT